MKLFIRMLAHHVKASLGSSCSSGGITHLAMIKLKIQRCFRGILILMMFMPYATSFMILDEGLRYKIEIIALLSLYVAGLIIPLVIKELDTTLLLWLYVFSLVGIPVGSDMTVHVTGITPDR